MKPFLIAVIGLPLAFCASSAMAHLVRQTAIPRLSVSLSNESTIQLPTQKPSITLQYEDVDVIALLRKISLEGNVEVIVSGEITSKIAQINLTKVSPEDAIEIVAKVADLDCQLKDKTYILSRKIPVFVPQSQIVSATFQFQDVPVRDVLKIIGEQSKMQITVADNIQDKLSLLCLKNETWENAIAKIAQAANLTCRKDENNHYFITKPEPPASQANELKPQINQLYKMLSPNQKPLL